MSDGIRIRVIERRRLRRARYEVDLHGERTVTKTPVTMLDPHLGVAEAWALVHAADDAFDGGNGDWVSLLRRA